MAPIYLRALEHDDLEKTHHWHNNRVLYESLGGTFRYVSREAEEAWLRKLLEYSTQQISLAICVTENSLHIGNIYLRNIDWVARHAELHMFIGEPDHRSKGYGQVTLRSLIKHAFNDLGLLRLYLYVLEDNEPAIGLYKKCGFVVEGKLRRHALKQGKFKDVLIMGLCTEDY